MPQTTVNNKNNHKKQIKLMNYKKRRAIKEQSFNNKNQICFVNLSRSKNSYKRYKINKGKTHDLTLLILKFLMLSYF